MKTYKKYITIFILLCSLLINCGCASYFVYQQSHRQVEMRKALVQKNERAVRDITLGYESDMEVSFRETVSENPGVQFGALLADLLTGIGSYEGIRSLTGNNNNTINDTKIVYQNSIDGDGNTIAVPDQNKTEN